MQRVIISAGHTSSDKGAVQGDLEEYKLTRKIAGYVVDELKKQDIVVLSVPDELDLRSRIEWINNTGYSAAENDVAVEIHINDGGLSGIEGWYKDRGENDSFRLTKSIVDEICANGNYKYQGVKSEYDHELKQLAFVHFTKTNSALVEVLYIDNPEDQKVLRDDAKLQEIAKSITNGIKKSWETRIVKEETIVKEEEKVSAQEPNETNEVQEPPAPDQMPFDQTMQDDFDDLYDEEDDLNLGAITAGATVGAAAVNQFGNQQQPVTTQPQIRPTPYTQPSPPTAMPGVQSGTVGGPVPFEERERRRKFIEDLYFKALGRGPSFQDSTYFINNWEGEVNLTLKMLDSQDHADILQKAIDFNKLSEEMKEKENLISRYKIEIRDKDGIIENLNRLVIEKNSHIEKLKSEIPHNGDKKTIDGKPVEKQNDEKTFHPPRTLADKIKDFIADFF